IKNYKELYSDVNGFYVLLTRYAKNDKPVKVAGELLDKIESVVSALNKGYTSYIEEANAQLAHFNNFPAANNITEDMKEYLHKSYNGYKDKFKEDVGKFRYGSERKIAESFIETADIIESAKEFLLMLDERYQAEKKASGLIDFSDYERYALSLLETRDENGVPVPSELCLRKSEAIKEVLIDEYQDANPMQDRIFTLLASKGSRFMVGDVKQSIYAFRNAFPDIFLSYKDAYPDVSEKAADARVLLRENFRCSQCVIDYVNHIFDTATKGTDYRREYEGEWLVHASDKPEIRRPVVVAYAPYSGVKGSASEARINEADYVAREIKRLVNEGSNNDGSPVRYSDIAVMMSATKGHSIEYKKAFAKYGIPYKSEDKTDFLKNPVVSLAISALNAVDDPTDEIPLCALMRSPVFDFTSDELYRIRISNKEVSFWDAVTYYARPARKKISKTAFRKDKTRHGGVSLCAKCRAFVRKLAEWRHAAEGVPCSAFIKSFFVSSGLLRIAAAESQKKSLMLLYEYSEKFKASSYNGISGFLDQIKQLGSGNREISDVASAGDPDSVTISTIHKAKGLEYKVCFLINADKEFNFSDVSNDLLLLQRKGMYFVIKNRKKLTKYKPACYCYAQEIMKENMRGEELRKLYVALTRAMERLYVTGIWKGDPREDPPSVMKDKSFFDYVIFDATREEKSFFDLQIILPSDGTQGYIPDRRRQSIIPGRELIDVINYEYPFKKASETAKKISVSELREGLLEDDEYDRSLIEVPASRVSYKPSFAAGYASTFADIGTANHVFMQFCDFKNVEKSGVEAEACRLRDTKMITEEQYGMLDKAALERFFKSALYAEMRVSPVLHREMRFSVKEDVFKNGEPVLIQGV
ncbi:MAG: UvrD-helicase domain-containing protein, partial [Clostridia bacterium]|nr:UvrD-helicase domain-containing protein [Clostridia bacterium]